MPETLDSTHLEAFIQQQGIVGEVLHLDAPTPTVETAAEAVNARPDQIVKSILFLVEGKAVMVISCGLGIVDRRIVAAHFGTSRRQVRLPDVETVLSLTGYPVGTVPPFGHRQPLPTLLDEKVLAQGEVYAGGGEHNALVRLAAQDIAQVTRAEVLDLQRPKTGSKGDSPA